MGTINEQDSQKYLTALAKQESKHYNMLESILKDPATSEIASNTSYFGNLTNLTGYFKREHNFSEGAEKFIEGMYDKYLVSKKADKFIRETDELKNMATSLDDYIKNIYDLSSGSKRTQITNFKNNISSSITGGGSIITPMFFSYISKFINKNPLNNEKENQQLNDILIQVKSKYWDFYNANKLALKKEESNFEISPDRKL